MQPSRCCPVDSVYNFCWASKGASKHDCANRQIVFQICKINVAGRQTYLSQIKFYVWKQHELHQITGGQLVPDSSLVTFSQFEHQGNPQNLAYVVCSLHYPKSWKQSPKSEFNSVYRCTCPEHISTENIFFMTFLTPKPAKMFNFIRQTFLWPFSLSSTTNNGISAIFCQTFHGITLIFYFFTY